MDRDDGILPQLGVRLPEANWVRATSASIRARTSGSCVTRVTKTFSATTGTAFYRLRTSAETVPRCDLARPWLSCKPLWQLLGLTSGRSLIGGPAPAPEAGRARVPG